MLSIIITTLFISFIAAINPGPLMILIISETLKHGKASGIKIALTPLITDLPIMLLSIFVLSKLSNLNILLGLISLFGSLYLLYLAYGSIGTKKVDPDLIGVDIQTTNGKTSFMKGVIANFLNPNPYIFFFTIVSPLVVKGMKINVLYGPLLVILFLGLFVAVTVTIALSVNAAKSFFSSKKYVYVIRLLGFILLYFSFNFFRESFKFFLGT